MDCQTKWAQLVIPINVPYVIWTLYKYNKQMKVHDHDPEKWFLTLFWYFLRFSFIFLRCLLPSGSASLSNFITVSLCSYNVQLCLCVGLQLTFEHEVYILSSEKLPHRSIAQQFVRTTKFSLWHKHEALSLFCLIKIMSWLPWWYQGQCHVEDLPSS